MIGGGFGGIGTSAGVSGSDGHHPGAPGGGEWHVRDVGGAPQLPWDAPDAGRAQPDRRRRQVRARRGLLRDGGVSDGPAEEELR